MKEDDKDFKEGLKTTSLFGGVQVFKILIAIVNSKFVALLLGPTGMGISGLLGSTTGLIGAATNLGLGTSAVRDVSHAYSMGDKYHFNRTVSVFRRLVWGTGLLGLLVCLVFSPLWSNLTFGNSDYIWAFALLSITFLLGQISSGQGVVLQGTRNFKMMAKSGIIGSFLGLFTGIPLYYFWGYDGIVPAMLLSSITGLLLTTYFARKVKVEKIEITSKDVFKEGKTMINMGFFISIQAFLNILCAYLVRIYIGRTGSIADVGLYNSGFNIINTYVGMVFAAMATEYYPRLSSYIDDDDKFSNAINQQMELSFLLLSPLIAAFLVLGELAIIILYSSKFLGATFMIAFGVFGIFLKAPGWCLGFTFLAKGDSKMFFVNELCAESYFLIFNILFYHLWGLNGLGASFIFNYLLYYLQVTIVAHIRYNYKLDAAVFRFFAPQFFISLLVLIIVIFMPSIYKYSLGSLLVAISIYLSYRELQKRLDVTTYIKSKIRFFRKK